MMIRAAIVFALFLLSVFVKIHVFWNATGFERGKTTFFWTESAMHFYLTEKVVNGESLSGVDKIAQFPEGVEILKDFTVGMPLVVGTAYKFMSLGMPLDVFILYFQAFFSALSVVAVFLLAQLIFSSPQAGFVSGFTYAIATAASARSSGAFLHEDFAFPLLLFSFLFFYLGILKNSQWRVVLSATLMGFSLLSWHLSQFFLLVFAIVIWIGHIKVGPLRAKVLYSFVTVLLAFALAFPLLRADGIFVSPAFALLIALCVFRYLDKKPVKVRAILAGSIFAVLLACYFFLGFGEQSHVFKIALAKIFSGLVKPSSPDRLDFETRAVWIEDDNSPDLFFLLYYTSLFIPIAAITWIHIFRRRQWTQPQVFVLCMSLVFLVMFLLVRRMLTTEIIFLSLLIGGFVNIPRKHKALVVIPIFLLALVEGEKTWGFNGRSVVERFLKRNVQTERDPVLSTLGTQWDLLAWVKTQTQKDDPILAPIGLSPVLLAYAHRPIVLHSKFESKSLRDKFERFATALFSSEERFLEFFKQSGARYFIYDAKVAIFEGKDSFRYMANKLHLKKDESAYLFHFRPQQLQHFELVYQNQSYRVFRLKEGGKSPEIFAQPIYNEEYLSSKPLSTIFSELKRSHEKMQLGLALLKGDGVEKAIEIFLSLRAWGVLEINSYLCYAHALIGRVEEAKSYCATELHYFPHSVSGRFHLGLLYDHLGDVATAQKYYQMTLDVDPRFGPALERRK